MKKKYSIAYLKTIKKINLPINIITRIFLSQFSPLVKKFINKKILDYSCGSGPYLNLFNSLGLKVHATEISTAITNELKKKFKNVVFKKSNNSHINFPNKYFDYILCSHSLYYLENVDQRFEDTVEEVSRVLKKGGYLICTFPNIKQSHLKLSKIKKNVFKIVFDKYKIRKNGYFHLFSSTNSIKKFFEKKFYIVEVGQQILKFKDLNENFYIAVLKKK